MRALQRALFATVIAECIALAAAPGLAPAQQKFPTKPIRLVVALPAGSQIDTIARILDLPDIKERLQAFSFVPAPTTPQEYDKILREQIATLSRLVRDAGLRPK